MKIRGTAMHVAEKYQQLARDAQASGDRVMSENYNQHAEHYLRIVAAAQPQQQPANQPAARNDGDEGYDAPVVNGSGSANGTERPSSDGAEAAAAAADGDLVDADSPQPFIEDMPVIDQEGQVNGKGQGGDGEDGEDKPRRRARTPRSRTPRRAVSETSSEPAADAGDTPPEKADAAGEEEPPKPRRRVARTRRPKAAEEAPAETAGASE